MGRIVQSGRLPMLTGAVLAVVAAAAVALAVVPGGLGDGPGQPVLSDAAGVTVEHPDATATPGRAGTRLVVGDVVRVGPAGRATVRQGSRTMRLLPGTSLALLGRDRGRLRAGTVLVDDRGAPALRLDVASLSVTAAADGVVRVDRGFAVRVGALAGTADVRNDVGRRVRVGALHQLRSDGRALPPRGPTPLALVDDAAERGTGLAVVLDDVLLRRWLAGATATPAGRAALTASFAAFRPGSADSCGTAADPGERLLPLAVGSASHRPGSLAQRYRGAVCYRAAGGSWGVVARLMRTTALRTLAAVHALEAAGAPGGGPSLAAGTAPRRPVPLAAAAPAPAAPTPGAPAPAPTPAPAPGRTATPSPAPQPGGGTPAPPPPGGPSPSPSPSGLIGQVIGLLPSLPALPGPGGLRLPVR